MAEKRKEVYPKVIRRTVPVPHVPAYGLFAGIPHFDAGGTFKPVDVTAGTIQNGPSADEAQNDTNNVINPTKSLPALLNPAESVGNTFKLVGDIGKGLASDLTVQNQYQAQLAPTQSTDYSGILGQAGSNALSGYGNFGQNQAQQAQLAQALQGVSNGTGPNPAQTMLNNATGANVANQAALMAGQRGAGANPGLIARQAAMAGAGTQQQAAGQAAALQSQQQLNALGAQGQVLGQMGQQNIAEQGVNAGLYGTSANAQNTQNANTISNYNDAQGLNQKTATENADNTNKTLGGLTNGIGALAALFAKGGMVPDHLRKMHAIYHADGGMVENSAPPIPTLPATVSSPPVPLDNSAPSSSSPSQSSGGGMGGMLSGVMDMFANGGMAGNFTNTNTSTGTATATSTPPAPMPAPSTPVQDRTRKSMTNLFDGYATESYADGGYADAMGSAAADDGSDYAPLPSNVVSTSVSDDDGTSDAEDAASARAYSAKNLHISKSTLAAMDQVMAPIGEGPVEGDANYVQGASKVKPHAVTPGRYYQRLLKAGKIRPFSESGGAADFRNGGRVGGMARVAGDSLKNDTQPAMLSPKEIVLPRSITMAPDAPEKAAEFVRALLKKQGHGNSTHHKEFHKALRAAILSRKS